MDNLELMKTANEVRKGIVTAVYNAKSGHPGGSDVYKRQGKSRYICTGFADGLLYDDMQ